LTLMKKTGRIIPHNPSILLEKTGYVTYSVPYVTTGFYLILFNITNTIRKILL